MSKLTQSTVNMRKTPKQRRSEHTVDTILEATAQLLVEVRDTDITTNEIAVRAGVSIGTLYQYFPNKTAVMGALARQERNVIVKDIVERLSGIEVDSIADTTRNIVRVIIDAFVASQAIRRFSVLSLVHHLEGEPGHTPDSEIGYLLAQTLSAKGLVQKKQSDVASFILTQALLGSIRSALLYAPELLKKQEFEDQLVRFIVGYLTFQTSGELIG